MWLKWLPWRYVISRVARAHGFIDPLRVMARLHHFAQPSQVSEPLELLRAGVVFHARGLINTRAIQHNLDWIWPYWIQRQFDPHDVSFVPRAFSITHVNLTHRNWTAVGLPDCDHLPIIDPRGLLTPNWDGWSLDCWLLSGEGWLVPARAPVECVTQRLILHPALTVTTQAQQGQAAILERADVVMEDGQPYCRLRVSAECAGPGLLILALRPANPEGVSFLHDLECDETGHQWRINGSDSLLLDPPPQRVCMSRYELGDVFADLPAGREVRKVHCPVGLATAAAIYPLEKDKNCLVVARVPLNGTRTRASPKSAAIAAAQPLDRSAQEQSTDEDSRISARLWEESLRGCCQLNIPDATLRFLFEAAVSNLVLHSPDWVYPGPYTYKRFWFRDAAFILHALLLAGMTQRVEKALRLFPQRQLASGYFRSQEGEWDSNGEVLWILHRFHQVTGTELGGELLHSCAKAGRWICRTRLPDNLDATHAGLMPAGFSAEHLGPNDFYYWDDFWSVAGLRCAAALVGPEDRQLAGTFQREAELLLGAINRSLAITRPQRTRRGMPASPYRRMDAGAIGSLAAGYPLQISAPRDPLLLDTADFLHHHCMVHGGFFQDMIHSGINPYLTLHLAQVLLRAGHPRYFTLMQTVARLASPTGQWPEAIHPHTLGGCMGDGEHIWAAAEWFLIIRNCFVRQENRTLVLASGVPLTWLEEQDEVSLGPTPTDFGPVTVRLRKRGTQHVLVRWEGQWRGAAPAIEVRLPASPPMTAPSGQQEVVVAVAADDVVAQPQEGGA